MNQETEGALSPWLRDVRLKRVAALIRPKSVVLDLACGNGFLADFLPEGCKYYGIDRLAPSSMSRFTEFRQLDLMEESSFEIIEKWLDRKPNYITSIAFLEHIKEPEKLLERSLKLLQEGGSFVGTTPHPRGRMVHDVLAKIGLCSRSGAQEHEAFLGRESLERSILVAGGVIVDYQQFLFGLNQLFTIKSLKSA